MTDTWILQATCCACAHALCALDRRVGALVMERRGFSLP